MQGIAGIIYGTEGIGKTSLALQFPGPITFCSIRESGFNNLLMNGQTPPNATNYQLDSWEELIHLTQKVESGTIVIDSLTGLQHILFKYVCETDFKDNFTDFMEYWKGPRVNSVSTLNRFLDLVDMRRVKKVNFIFIGHAIVDEIPDTMGADYLSYVLNMDKGIRSAMTTWSGFIFFLQLSINITRATEVDRKTKLVTEGKALDDDKRLIYTSKAPGHSAKNSWNLPPIISMGSSPQEAYKNLWAKMPKMYQDNFPIGK